GAGTGEARDDLPPAFVELCGFFRELVGAAVHSGVVVAVEVLFGVEDATGFLARRPGIEVDEWGPATHGAREHGKVGADRGDLAGAEHVRGGHRITRSRGNGRSPLLPGARRVPGPLRRRSCRRRPRVRSPA